LRTGGSQSEIINRKFEDIAEEFQLNYEQKAAYDLFIAPFNTLLSDKNEAIDRQSESDVTNRCMYLGGSGGTRKSRVLHAIRAGFEQAGCNNMLVISATTGCAANLIGGSTIDSICKFVRKMEPAVTGNSPSDDEWEMPVTIDNS
jgi:hypothetical protein